MKQCIGDLRCIVISARDVDRAVEFWCAVLGSDIGPRYDPYVELIKDGQLKVTIQHVENDWALGSNVHFDIKVSDIDEGIKRVEALGGKLV